MYILNYHGVMKEVDEFERIFQKHLPWQVFESQIKFLKRKRNPLTLGEFLDRYQKKRLGDDDILVSFDDGYRNLFEGAIQLLEGLAVPAVFSVATGRVGSANFFADRVEKAVWFTRREKLIIAGREFDLTNKERRIVALMMIKTWLKGMAVDDIKTLVPLIVRQAEVDESKNNPDKFKVFSWDEIRDLENRLLFDVIHHSHEHYPLSQYATEQEIVEDINRCLVELRNEAGVEPRVFVYPFGAKKNHDERVVAAVKSLGFRQGWTVQNRPVEYDKPFEIYRLEMTGRNFELVQRT